MASPALADEASRLFNKGRDIEATLDYEGAFALYNQAYQLKPKNLAYQTASIRVRALAASQHVHRGQQLRDAGHLEEAMLEFRAAALTDPSSFIAQQEIRRTVLLLQSAKAKSTATVDSGLVASQNHLNNTAGPVELSTLSTAPITLKLTEDAKVVYTTIGKLAGINVVFDPDFKSQRISVELVRVTLDEALQIVRMESRSFTRPVTSNTIYIAADTPAKRKEVEENVMETFYLTNLSQPSDLTDIATTIRSTLDLTRITPMPSQGALIVRGTPDQLTLVRKLINDMDKARPEVSVEVMVMQVTRERIRQLGIQPPTSATVSFLGTSGGGSSNGTGSAVSLSNLTQLAASDFAVTIPQVTANALFSDSQSKLIQNPQIRALDGQRASLRIGQRYPIATGSFSSGLGGAGISPLVNTQFQYIDVGVNIDITPRVHGDNDVTLKLVLDITAVDSMTSIGGITQPIIGQRKIEHEIRLKDGEINLLGGMLEEADAKSLSGLPWLSSVPLLRYFFSSEQTDKRQNELVFVLIPHILRIQELDKTNHQQLDIGTSNAIDLRRLSSVGDTGGAGDSSDLHGIPRPASTLSAPGADVAHGVEAGDREHVSGTPHAVAVPVIATTVPGTGAVSLSLTAPKSEPLAGQTFIVDLLADGAQNLLSMSLDLDYDASALQLVGVTQGLLLSQDSSPTLTSQDDPVHGRAHIAAGISSHGSGRSSTGSIVRLTFVAKKQGQSTIEIENAAFRDSTQRVANALGSKLPVTVRSKT